MRVFITEPRALSDPVWYVRMHFDVSRAVSELGLPQNDPREALRKAVEWFQQDHSGGGL
jgi:hypothetical protein